MHSSHYYSEGPGPGSGHGHFDRLRGHSPQLPSDQYSETSFRSDLEPPPTNYGRDYLTSDDLKGPEGHHAPPVAGRYGGGSSHKRPTIGQAYACQSSPTQPHPPEKKQFPKQSDQEHDQDASAKQGLRSWRIHSYLNTYEDGGEEGLTQPIGPDAFEDPPSEETPASRFGIKDPPKVSSKARLEVTRPRFGKPILPESSNKDSASTTTKDHSSVSDFKSFLQDKNEREVEKDRERESDREVGVDVEAKGSTDIFLSKHESFRSRINPVLQRSSRLRSSLIFSSSKAEVHKGSQGLKTATEEDEGSDKGHTSSLVAQLLEKRRSREPYDWRKRTEDKDKDKDNEEIEKEKEGQKTNNGVKTTTVERSERTSSSLNTSDSASQYFKDLAAKRKAAKMESESPPKITEPAEKKPDVPDKPLYTTTPTSTVSTSSAELEPKKPDISAKLAELTRKPSFTSSKPPINYSKPSVSNLKLSETSQSQKEENGSEGLKKDLFKSLKPLPSPKLFKKDQLKFKSMNPRRISCDEEILTRDATDAEKSELKKSRSPSASALPHDEFKGGQKLGSNTSLNTLGEGKGDGKAIDFLKKQTQKLKGILGPKDKEKRSSEDRSTGTARDITEDSRRKQSSSSKDTGSSTTDQTSANHKTSTGTSGLSRYQAPASSVLFSSNLRDDTKVILEQISANSQKNRMEKEETSADGDNDSGERGLERQNSLRKNRFLRLQGNNTEREGLLKRIESLRKEKKVYSRFEVVYHCLDESNHSIAFHRFVSSM